MVAVFMVAVEYEAVGSADCLKAAKILFHAAIARRAGVAMQQIIKQLT